jgi:hypothetical protein
MAFLLKEFNLNLVMRNELGKFKLRKILPKPEFLKHINVLKDKKKKAC